MQSLTNAPAARRRRRRRARAAFLAAVLPVVTSAATAEAARYAWNGSVSGNWSNRLNWKGGVVPTSSQENVLEFWPTGTAPVISNNDLPGTFTLWFIDGPAGPDTTLTGNRLRFVVNPNQTTFPFALIGNGSPGTASGVFTIHNDIRVDAPELHLVGGVAPGSLVLKGDLSGSGRVYSRGADA